MVPNKANKNKYVINFETLLAFEKIVYADNLDEAFLKAVKTVAENVCKEITTYYLKEMHAGHFVDKDKVDIDFIVTSKSDERNGKYTFRSTKDEKVLYEKEGCLLGGLAQLESLLTQKNQGE